ncbi:hypothetical protein [Plastoroseomonas arctica]|uniref:Uncharacterized protein n=1 Tax=Plastoroseomonas arctica TaxID=1509237 RepID=A0AAF1JYM4_9PROT|nr:hypothetical protein [Plastoroseomonas arctica]MBR0657079.1 hypothetical protein [Plastoroseomonas arctica]
MRDPFAELPAWAEAVARRVTFLAQGTPGARRQRRALRRALRDLHPRLTAPGGDAEAADAYCHASLELAEAAVAVRPDLADIRPAFARLCVMARAELAGSRDDRGLLAELNRLEDPGGLPHGLMRVPGRVVFLAALAGTSPEDAAGAAAMLASDLASLARDLPCAALVAAAVSRPEVTREA